MKTQSLPLTYSKAGLIFLAIFAATALFFFTSCSTARGGCEMSKGFSGYGKTR